MASLTANWAKEIGLNLEENLESLNQEEILKNVLDLAKHSVRVIYPTSHFIVQWADGKTKNSLTSSTIILNPDPLFDPKITLSTLDRIDIIIGSALLNAGHRKAAFESSEYRLKMWGQNKKREGIAFQIWSAAELFVAELIIKEEFPGYDGYFDAYKKYYYTEDKRIILQEKINQTNDRTNLDTCLPILIWEMLVSYNQRLNLKAYFTSVCEVIKNFTEKLDSFDRVQESIKATDFLLGYYRKKDEYNQFYTKDKEETSDSSDKEESISVKDLGIESLIPKSDEVEKEIIESSNEQGFNENLIDDIFKGEKEFKEDGESEFEDSELPNQTKPSKKNELLEETKSYKVVDQRKLITSSTSSVYQKDLVSVRSLINPIRNALKFRNEEKKFKEYGLKSGDIDPENLSKLAYKDYNIFEKEEVITKPNIHISLLIDESGSMNSIVKGNKTRVDLARESAILLANALSKINGITFYTFGHSTDNKKCLINIYSIEQKQRFESFGNIKANSENYDGYALAYVGNYTAKNSQANDKIIIYINDGLPSAPNYYGKSAMGHTRKVVQSLLNKSIPVLAIGIGGVNEKDMLYMYGNKFLNLNNISELPKKLSKIVTQLIRNKS